MKKWMLAGFGLMFAVLALPVCSQETAKASEKKDEVAATWEAREQAFLKKSNITPGQTVVYKILATKNEFEALKRAKPNMFISDKMTGDVRVITERSDVEVAYYERNGMHVKNLKASDLPSVAPASVNDVEIKQTVYRRVASYQEYQETLDRSQKSTTVKITMDGLTWFMEKSEVEVAAERAMEPPRKVLKGLPFPSFNLASTDGLEKSEKSFQSKLTLVNFFFDKCAPCIEETPALNQFAKEHPEIQVIAMTMDSRDQAKKYVEEHRFTWPIVYSAQKLIYQDLGVMSFPSFVLVDENGMILGEQAGLETRGDVSKELRDWTVSKKLHDWILGLRSNTAK